jgi:CHAT domain-containing protein
MGVLLQKRGARAVIGTLWAIQDEGSAALMQAFYKAHGEQHRMSKAAALQAAQLDLLQGRINSSNPAVSLKHPYYWAPFLLMGNWL